MNIKQASIPFWLFGVLYLVISAVIISIYNGTGDAGDSIQHFLIAKYAPVHPELYFDHWGKPIFTLLASPFAQFGFIGIKVFNVLVGLGSLHFTFKVADHFKLRLPLLASLLLLSSSLFFVLTFSSLTEPLFAFFLILGIYLLLKDKTVIALILLSFLPFIRSEGMIILGIIGLYLLYKRQFKNIPFILTGHVIYSIIGGVVFQDILWLFTQNPYARLSSTYGSGNAFHFVEQLQYVVGLPVYILFFIGIASFIYKLIIKKTNTEWTILIIGCVVVFITAHSIFWVYGIFNSMGLKRVLIAITPLIALVALEGFNAIILLYSNQIKRGTLIFKSILMTGIIVFQFTSNHTAIHWKKDLSLIPDQICAIEIADKMKQLSLEKHTLHYAHPYLSLVLDHDPFNRTSKDRLNLNLIKSNDIIIWENWFAPLEEGINKDRFSDTLLFEQLIQCNKIDEHRTVEYNVYRKK